jgi:hypothetical protein
MFDDPNRLLFVISARQSMTWASYCEALDLLISDSPTSDRFADRIASRRSLLQCLEALGHLDAIYNQGQSIIVITPATLCLLPKGGLPEAVLTGSRWLNTQTILKGMKQVQSRKVKVIIERYSGPLGLLPDRILVKADSLEALSDFCKETHLNYPLVPPSWTLLNWCGSFQDYEETLDFRISQGLNWARYDFCSDSFTFTRTLYELKPRYSRYINPTTGLPLHVFFKEGLGSEVDLNWGRYLFLKAKDITVTAYDEERHRLCVPVRIPLPGVVAKIVCLCSGKPPVHTIKDSLVPGITCKDWLIFEEVPPQITIPAMTKVGQSPVHVEIK